MAAQYADESNLGSAAVDEIPRKLDALAAHCDRLGRDRSEIAVTSLQMALVAPTMEEAEADLREVAATKGWNDEIIDLARGLLVFGDPDTVGERLEAVMATGIDGLTINLPANGPKLERIGLLGEIGLAVTKP